MCRLRKILVYLCLLCLTGLGLQVEGESSEGQNENGESDISFLIGWLLEEGRELKGLSFAEVIRHVSGHEVLVFDSENPVHVETVAMLGRVFDGLIAELEDTEHPVHAVGRINEVSGELEELLLAALAAQPGYRCGFPLTSNGEYQRSGYPDLELVHEASGTVFYLDPKLYNAKSESSSFRTFYYEPKGETNKVNADAVHFIAGIRHGGRDSERWAISGWKLIDLAGFEVKLKAEFQASNRDLYREKAVVAESGRK